MLKPILVKYVSQNRWVRVDEFSGQAINSINRRNLVPEKDK
jgi:hypothetical protein